MRDRCSVRWLRFDADGGFSCYAGNLGLCCWLGTRNHELRGRMGHWRSRLHGALRVLGLGSRTRSQSCSLCRWLIEFPASDGDTVRDCNSNDGSPGGVVRWHHTRYSLPPTALRHPGACRYSRWKTLQRVRWWRFDESNALADQQTLRHHFCGCARAHYCRIAKRNTRNQPV